MKNPAQQQQQQLTYFVAVSICRVTLEYRQIGQVWETQTIGSFAEKSVNHITSTLQWREILQLHYNYIFVNCTFVSEFSAVCASASPWHVPSPGPWIMSHNGDAVYYTLSCCMVNHIHSLAQPYCLRPLISSVPAIFREIII